jgi:dihydroorotate dehydrogenase electron transfer subunit
MEKKNSLLIGCGVGIAPILFLSKELIKYDISHKSIICSFSNTGLKDDFLCKSWYITEDGSSGIKGRLDDYLEEMIDDYKPEKIYICGPNPAMKFVNSIAEPRNIPIEAALEREFACGTGVCMGCVIQVKENNKIVNKRICKDGPVFKGSEVLW